MKDYDDALERAKCALGSGTYDDETIKFLFPELKESESEKTRKDIINVLMNACKENGVRIFEDDCKRFVSWLMDHRERKWSELDSSIIEDALYFLQEYRRNVAISENDFQNAITCEQWILNLDPNNHKAQEFDEYDWQMIDRIRGIILSRAHGPIDEMDNRKRYVDALTWFDNFFKKNR